jgi:predicted RNase H-like HicB family nuclease
MKQAYPIILTPSDGEYVVYSPDFDINTSGRDLAEAISMAEDAISLCAITLQDMKKPVPAPSATVPPCGDDDLTAFALVDFDAYRRANDMRSVRKNVTIPS